MTHVPQSPGGLAASGSAAESGLQAGAHALRDVAVRIGTMYDDAVEASGDDDAATWREMDAAVGAAVRQALDGDAAERKGFIRALSELLLCVHHGLIPADLRSWEPLGDHDVEGAAHG